MITINSLIEEIENFGHKSYRYFLQRGLDKKINSKNVLAIVLKNRLNEEILKYHSFNNSKFMTLNDIPFFHPHAPSGYSLFCTQFEYIQLIEYLKIKNKKIKRQSIEEDSLTQEPIPSKTHFICQICRVKFNKYLEHINSSFHKQNSLQYKSLFIRIKLTFRRIRSNIEEQNDNIKEENMSVIELKSSSEEDKDSNNKRIKKDNTKKVESFFINYAIKDNTRENINNNLLDIAAAKKNEKKYEDKMDDISRNNILNVLENIGKNTKDSSIKFIKRKKNVKNKYLFNENYIYDLQKFTENIAHFNNINKFK
jgi:hypothetical protein